MRDLSYKSVPLLLSKLSTTIATSHRSRDSGQYYNRREDLKDEIIGRGKAALDPLLDFLMRQTDTELCRHLADIIGAIGAQESVIPLAKILAEPYPHPTKRCAARALKIINTPDALVAINIWQGRIARVQVRLEAITREGKQDDPMLESLTRIAEQHQASPLRIADAWLLLTSPEQLSQDAQIRLNALLLTPQECEELENTADS